MRIKGLRLIILHHSRWLVGILNKAPHITVFPLNFTLTLGMPHTPLYQVYFLVFQQPARSYKMRTKVRLA